MQHLKSSFEYSFWHGFKSHPTLFCWIPLTDASMNAVAILGIVLSLLVVLGVNSWICHAPLVVARLFHCDNCRKQ